VIVTIEQDEDGELILPLGEEIMQGLDWKIGDTVTWTDNGDGSWTLNKKETETEIVLVETISTFKITYAVEVPKGKKEWALEDVAMDSVSELAQVHIGEDIFSHWVVTEEEYLHEFDKRNDYLKEWDTAQKMEYIYKSENNT
jgi:hypothetical protein